MVSHIINGMICGMTIEISMIPLHYSVVIVIKVALKGYPVHISDVEIIEL